MQRGKKKHRSSLFTQTLKILLLVDYFNMGRSKKRNRSKKGTILSDQKSIASDTSSTNHSKCRDDANDSNSFSFISSVMDQTSIQSVVDKKNSPPQKHKLVCVASSAALLPSPTGLSASFENLDIPLLREIVSFIGPNQYRFVAMINGRFRMTHLQLYPQNTNTYINVSTLNHAKIVFEELKYIGCYDKFYKGDQLCQFAIENGNLPLLQFFHSRKCPFPSEAISCSSAAKNGHLHVLIWLHGNIFIPYKRDETKSYNWSLYFGCLWGSGTLSVAAKCGHLNVFKWGLEHGCRWDCTSADIKSYSPNIKEWIKGHYVLSKKICSR